MAVGNGVCSKRIGDRILVDPWLRDPSLGHLSPANGSKINQKNIEGINRIEKIESYCTRIC